MSLIGIRRNQISVLTAAALLGFGGMSFAQVTGTVKLDGKAPEMKAIDMSGVKECNDQHADPVYEETVVTGDGGTLANVVVAIKTDDPASLNGKVPDATATLAQKGCQYVPHVMAVMVGEKMAVKNEDPFLHNVHALAQQNPPFNFGQPNKDDGKPIEPMKTAEKFRVKCDVHPWMSAYVAVFEHPFFAVSDEKGAFSIKGLPDGDYDVEAWHESLGTQTGKVTVKGGKGTVDFTFKPESSMAPMPSTGTETVSAKADTKAACCSTDINAVKADTSMTLVQAVKGSDGRIEFKPVN